MSERARYRNYIGYFRRKSVAGALEKVKEKKAKWFVGRVLEIPGKKKPQFVLVFGFDHQVALSTVTACFSSKDVVGPSKLPACDVKMVRSKEWAMGESEVMEFGQVPSFKMPSEAELMDHINENVENEEEALGYFKISKLYKYVTDGKQLRMYFMSKYAPKIASKFTLEDFCCEPMNSKSLASVARVVVGPTNMGKSEWVKAHFRNPAIVKTQEDFKALASGGRDAVILDDMNTSLWEPLQFLNFLKIEEAVTQNIKYSSVVIPAGMPRVIITNSESLLWPRNMEAATKKACLRRICVSRITRRLYKKAAKQDVDGALLDGTVHMHSSADSASEDDNEEIAFRGSSAVEKERKSRRRAEKRRRAEDRRSLAIEGEREDLAVAGPSNDGRHGEKVKKIHKRARRDREEVDDGDTHEGERREQEETVEDVRESRRNKGKGKKSKKRAEEEPIVEAGEEASLVGVDPEVGAWVEVAASAEEIEVSESGKVVSEPREAFGEVQSPSENGEQIILNAGSVRVENCALFEKVGGHVYAKTF